MYILAFLPSTTAIRLFISTPASSLTSATAAATSLNLPTPEGSITTRSGLNCSTTCLRERAKSPTSVQQMQPLFISVTSMPAFFMKPLSMPISPNSFSMSTTRWPLYTLAIISLMKVVFPAPRKPDTISTFVIIYSPFWL